MPLRRLAMTQSILQKLKYSIRYRGLSCQHSNMTLKVKKSCVYLFLPN